MNLTRNICPILVFSTILLCLSCSNELEKVQSIERGDNEPNIITKDVEVTYSDSGFVRFKLFAPLREDYIGEVTRSEMPKGIEIKFFDNDLNITSTLKADKAIYYSDEGLIYATGNVVVRNEQGQLLETQSLVWNDKTDMVYSNDFVKISSPDKIIYGQYLYADRNFSNCRILYLQGTLSVKE